MTGAIYPGPPWLAAEDGLSPALTGAIHSPAATLPPRPRSLLRLLETLWHPVGENKPGCLCRGSPRPPPPPRPAGSAGEPAGAAPAGAVSFLPFCSPPGSTGCSEETGRGQVAVTPSDLEAPGLRTACPRPGHGFIQGTLLEWPSQDPHPEKEGAVRGRGDLEPI